MGPRVELPDSASAWMDVPGRAETGSLLQSLAAVGVGPADVTPVVGAHFAASRFSHVVRDPDGRRRWRSWGRGCRADVRPIRLLIDGAVCAAWWRKHMYSLTLGDIAREHRRTYAQDVAAVCRGARYTYRELDDRVNRLANRLAAAGVGEGDRVLWLGQNCHRVLELLLAGAKLGAMTCPVNWRQSADEVAFVIDDLAPTVVVWQDEVLGELNAEARAKASFDGALWIRESGPADGDQGYEEWLAAGSDTDPGVEVDPGSAVLVIYTAAFGGRPNGSMLTHVGLTTQDANLFKLADMWPGFTYLNNGPLFHIGTFMYTVATFHIGGKNVFTRRADPQDVMELIAGERCKAGFVLPPTIAKIVELNADRRYDLSSFRSPLRIEGWSDMVQPDETPFGTRSMGGFGQTEVTGLDVYAAYGGIPGVSTAGRPSPWTRVRIVDEDGKEVPDGDTGEIVFHGPMVHRGYWNRPEVNAHRTRSGGWHTNDLGRRTPEGVVAFIGPKTQMIKSGVENIYPAEVEACIERLAGVREAAIIGVPDPRYVQSVKAIVVLDKGASVGAEDVIAHCREQIASYKKPKTVEFLDALPRTPAGQKDYAALDEKFGGGGYPGGATRSQ
jgi:acyl-CoA synthetase (AMP-forming)/AMP-acid ligase II